MRALLSRRVGPPESLSLGELPDPAPGPGEVRIRVMVCAVNYPDVLICEDKYQFKPARPFAPGAEVAGFIDAVGDGVTSLQPGTRVLASGVYGGLAELFIGSADRCFPIPDSMPFEDAAALIVTYGTAIYALQSRANLQRNETLLVLGAAGGVGMAAVELGKSMGARVIGAVSSPQKARVVKERGAQATLIYPRGPLDRDGKRALADQIREAAGGEIDVVFDAVGGDYSEAALRTMAWNGRFLVVGFPAGIANIPLNLPLLKGCSVSGVFWGKYIEKYPAEYRAEVASLLQLYESGQARPLVMARYPFELAGQAIAQLAARSAVGKIVVKVGTAASQH